MSTNLTRREFLHAGGLSAVTLALASCAPKPTPTPTAAPSEAEEPAESPTSVPPAEEAISMRMAFWDSWALEAYEHEAELFKELYPNVTMNIEMTSFGEYNQKLLASMAGGVPADVIGQINMFFTSMASTESLMSLEEFVERDDFDLGDFLEGNLKDGMWLGKLYVIPFSADAMWLFYNLDAFKEAGLKTPTEHWKEGTWDWTTYLDLAAKLTTGEGMDKTWGTENIMPDYDFKFYPHIWQNGGDLFDSAYTKCILDDDKAMEAFQFAYECRKYAPLPEDETAGSAESGRLMMFTEWELYNTFFVGELPYEWGLAPPPASPNTGATYFCGDAPGWAIPVGVKQADLSWEWIKFLLTPESLVRLFHAIAAPPPRISMLETPDVFVNHPNYPNPELCWEITQARMKAFKNTPKVSTYAEMKTVMSEEMSLVWVDEMSLEEGVQNVSRKWTELLEGAIIDPDLGCEGPMC